VKTRIITRLPSGSAVPDTLPEIRYYSADTILIARQKFYH
jgi:hypothetical protein